MGRSQTSKSMKGAEGILANVLIIRNRSSHL